MEIFFSNFLLDFPSMNFPELNIFFYFFYKWFFNSSKFISDFIKFYVHYFTFFKITLEIFKRSFFVTNSWTGREIEVSDSFSAIGKSPFYIIYFFAAGQDASMLDNEFLRQYYF